jgi:hypothetical protein
LILLSAILPAAAAITPITPPLFSLRHFIAILRHYAIIDCLFIH